MPQELDLNNYVASSGINEKGRSDIVFAVRALAVIRVHDSEEAKERNLTIREICDVDPWLKEHSESLMHYLFRAFGRNCIPVLTKYMEGVQSPEDLDDNILLYARGFAERLGLNPNKLR